MNMKKIATILFCLVAAILAAQTPNSLPGSSGSGSGGGSGTVTSVSLTMPTGFTVTGVPITTTGTAAITTTLNGNIRGNGSGFTTGNVALGSEVSGTLPIANGGTGLSTLGTANQLQRVNAGATALEYFTPTYLTSEVDGSTTNELQTIANTSDATSHTVTLSNSGGTVKLVEGSNITLTTTGTSSDGIITIASTGGGTGQGNIQIQDEGSNQGSAGDATTYNFTGKGATASVSSTTATLNFPQLVAAATGTGSLASNFYPYGTLPDSALWYSLWRGSWYLKKTASVPLAADNGFNVLHGNAFVETDPQTLQWDASAYNKAVLEVVDDDPYCAKPSNVNSNYNGEIFQLLVRNNSISTTVTCSFDPYFYKTASGTPMPPQDIEAGGAYGVYNFYQVFSGDSTFFYSLDFDGVNGADNLGNHTATQDLNMAGFDVTNIKAETYGVGWNSDNSAPTKNDTYDKIEAVIASIPTVTDKVTKGGDTDGAALVLGTNDNNNVAIERNNVQEVILKSGELDITGNNLTNVAALSADNAQLQNYATYSTTGTNLSNSMCHYVTALGSTTTMTATTTNIADKALFFVKNLSSVNKVVVAAGAGLTTNGNMYVNPLATVWFQRVGTVIQCIGASANGEYTAQLTQATNANGVYIIAHPFGTTPIRFASISITSTTEPYLWTIYSFGNGVVNFQVWNPTTGLPLALPNKVITVLIKI